MSTPAKRDSYYTFKIVSPPPAPTVELTPWELENLIESVDATQIDILAKQMATKTMAVLEIDTTYAPDQFLKAKFDPKSKMLEVLAPALTKQIIKAFSAASAFVETGAQIDLFADNDSGLLDQISDKSLKSRIAAAKENCMKLWNLNTLSSFTFALSVEGKKSSKELYFDIKMSVNGSRLSRDGGTLSEFAENFQNELT